MANSQHCNLVGCTVSIYGRKFKVYDDPATAGPGASPTDSRNDLFGIFVGDIKEECVNAYWVERVIQ